jgi:hypothetical protein
LLAAHIEMIDQARALLAWKQPSCGRRWPPSRLLPYWWEAVPLSIEEVPAYGQQTERTPRRSAG